MASRAHKWQHFIPVSYLRAWCDPDCPPGQTPYVWLFDRDSRSGKRRAPHNIFAETDFYTESTESGERDVELERRLSLLESDFVKLRDGALMSRRILSQEEHAVVCFYCAAMHVRTRCMRDHIGGQWGRVLEGMEELEEWAKTASPAELRALESPFHSPEAKSMGIEDVRRIVDQPAQTAVREYMRTEVRLLAKMRIAVLYTDDDVGFITSDSPCIWIDPSLNDVPPALRSPGLGSPTIEVMLPLSPSRLLLLTWQGIQGYVLAPLRVVDDVNRMIRGECEAQYVVRRNQVRDRWFEVPARVEQGVEERQ